MFHGYDLREHMEDGASFYQDLFRLGDCFQAISAYSEGILRRFGADRSKLMRHSTGIRPGLFHAHPRTMPGLHEPMVILSVGRLVPEKAFHVSLQALRLVRDRMPEQMVNFRIVGDGPLRCELERLTKELDLQECVQFLGPMGHAAVAEEMGRAHVLLLSSEQEVLPTVLLEAQASELPAVATDIAAVPEAVVPDRSALLVPPGDFEALAERLGYLLGHPEVWGEMGRVGREFVEANYDIDRLNDRLVRIYEELLSGRGVGDPGL
jgi:colanic acid/amylovoran biosynthesis glycosyltransferase